MRWYFPKVFCLSNCWVRRWPPYAKCNMQDDGKLWENCFIQNFNSNCLSWTCNSRYASIHSYITKEKTSTRWPWLVTDVLLVLNLFCSLIYISVCLFMTAVCNISFLYVKILNTVHIAAHVQTYVLLSWPFISAMITELCLFFLLLHEHVFTNWATANQRVWIFSGVIYAYFHMPMVWGLSLQYISKSVQCSRGSTETICLRIYQWCFVQIQILIFNIFELQPFWWWQMMKNLHLWINFLKLHWFHQVIS